MEILRKKKLQGYILLESLIGLAVLTVIVTLILGELGRDNQRLKINYHQEEVLNLAQMGLQTYQNRLSDNGVTMEIEESENGVRIYDDGKEVLYVQVQ